MSRSKGTARVKTGDPRISLQDGGVRIVQRFGRDPLSQGVRGIRDHPSSSKSLIGSRDPHGCCTLYRRPVQCVLLTKFKLIKSMDVPLAKLYGEAIASPHRYDPMCRDVRHLQIMVRSGDDPAPTANGDQQSSHAPMEAGIVREVEDNPSVTLCLPFCRLSTKCSKFECP